MKKLLIIAGPSAVGKTTLVEQMLAKSSDFVLSRSATTRGPRGDGHDGEYVYLTADEFIDRAKSGAMLEYTQYSGNLYGTPISEIDRILSLGKTPVLILDREGVHTVKTEGKYHSFAVYLYECPNVLEERLYSRYIGAVPTPEGLKRLVERKERNLEELSSREALAELFDLLVRNDELDKCIEKILAAYKSEEKPDNSAASEEIRSLLENKFKTKQP